jgi:hypothetical protein
MRAACAAEGAILLALYVVTDAQISSDRVALRNAREKLMNLGIDMAVCSRVVTSLSPARAGPKSGRKNEGCPRGWISAMVFMMRPPMSRPVTPYRALRHVKGTRTPLTRFFPLEDEPWREICSRSVVCDLWRCAKRRHAEMSTSHVRHRRRMNTHSVAWAVVSKRIHALGGSSVAWLSECPGAEAEKALTDWSWLENFNPTVFRSQERAWNADAAVVAPFEALERR